MDAPSECGSVTQLLDTSTFPGSWIVNYSEGGDSDIYMPYFDADIAGVYSVQYTATMDVDSSWTR